MIWTNTTTINKFRRLSWAHPGPGPNFYHLPPRRSSGQTPVPRPPSARALPRVSLRRSASSHLKDDQSGLCRLKKEENGLGEKGEGEDQGL